MRLENPSHGFHVMAEAALPQHAEKSRARYVVAIGIPVGLVLLVILIFLGRELRGLRLSTAREVAFWGRGPVIGTSAWPRVPKAIDDLIADLDDFVPDAIGNMLVVGTNDASHELAHQFASATQQRLV